MTMSVLMDPLRHVQNICKSCFAQISYLKHLICYQTRHAAPMAANALVGSGLDYCNSLFRSLSALDLRKLQCAQNSLARIVNNTTKHSHITPVRKTPHWLPMEHCSIFKIALLVYKFLHSGYPKYFVPFLNYLNLNLDIVSITHVTAKLMACSLKSHALPLP